MNVKYRRANDERWWKPRRRPMPKHWPVEVKLKSGEVHPHAFGEGDTVRAYTLRWPVKMREVAGWRYQLPPTIRFPGDPPGSWTCPDELYVNGSAEEQQAQAAGD
jgi:hypothetical protein